MIIPAPTLPTSVSHPNTADYVDAVKGITATSAQLIAANRHALVKNKTDNLAGFTGVEITACANLVYGGTAAEAQAVADSMGHGAFAQICLEAAMDVFGRAWRGLPAGDIVPVGKVLTVTRADGSVVDYRTGLAADLVALYAKYAPTNAVVAITAAPTAP